MGVQKKLTWAFSSNELKRMKHTLQKYTSCAMYFYPYSIRVRFYYQICWNIPIRLNMYAQKLFCFPFRFRFSIPRYNSTTDTRTHPPWLSHYSVTSLFKIVHIWPNLMFVCLFLAEWASFHPSGSYHYYRWQGCKSRLLWLSSSEVSFQSYDTPTATRHLLFIVIYERPSKCRAPA
jgi:hypothetical protein